MIVYFKLKRFILDHKKLKLNIIYLKSYFINYIGKVLV